MDLYQHQKEILNEDPKLKGIFQGTGSGKTRTVLELAEGTTLIICPKQQKLDGTYETNRARFDIVLYFKVVSKEEFRRDWETYPPFDTIICDEAHNMLGVLPDTRRVKGVEVPKTSQLFHALDSYVKKYPPKRFYLTTATPASKPMNVWAIAKLYGKDWDFYKFREKYYIAKKIGFRTVWLPKNSQELKDRLAELIKQFGYTGQLSDWFDVPDQTHKVVYVQMTPEQVAAADHIKSIEADPMGVRARLRTIENGVLYDTELVSMGEGREQMKKVTRYFMNEKVDKILDYAMEFPKLLIFANYKAQIRQIAVNLANAGYKVLTLTGDTKDRKSVMETAEREDRCIVIAQSSISEGYEFKTCPCVIFASKSYRYLHYNQALGRVLRSDAIKKNLYIHLVTKGGMDEACHKAIEAGNDFQERIMNNED